MGLEFQEGEIVIIQGDGWEPFDPAKVKALRLLKKHAIYVNFILSGGVFETEGEIVAKMKQLFHRTAKGQRVVLVVQESDDKLAFFIQSLAAAYDRNCYLLSPEIEPVEDSGPYHEFPLLTGTIRMKLRAKEVSWISEKRVVPIRDMPNERGLG